MSKNNLPGEAFSDRENAETYEQLDLSELIYGMPMGEADFMLNEAQEIQYNEMCQECRQDCKQSFRCQVVEVRVCALAQKNLGLESLFPPIKQIKMALTKRDEGSAKEPIPEGLAPF